MSYRHLSARERTGIFYMHQAGYSLREIGRRLERCHTTISRELRCNKRVMGFYYDRAARYFSDTRQQKARHQRKRQNQRLYQAVIERLKQDHSPDAIAGRLRDEYSRNSSMHVSHTCIYNWLYNDARSGGMLHTHLALQHKRRKKQWRFKGARNLFKGRRGIEQRPSVVDRRNRFGDWVKRHHVQQRAWFKASHTS